MTPVPLFKVSDDSGDTSPNSFVLDDSNSHTDEENQKHLGWPFVKCVVSIVEITCLFPK